MNDIFNLPPEITNQILKLNKIELQELLKHILSAFSRTERTNESAKVLSLLKNTKYKDIIDFLISETNGISSNIYLGNNNQMGDVNISGIAARDIINIYFHQEGKPPVSKMITATNQVAHHDVLTISDSPRGLPARLQTDQLIIRNVLASYTTQESGSGYFSIYGEIHNKSDKTVYMPDVEVAFFDENSTNIDVITGSGQRFCESLLLEPNSSAPFHYYTYSSRKDMDRISQYDIKVTYSPRPNGWIEVPFEIKPAGPDYDYVIARNVTDSIIQGMHVIITVYDEEGRVSEARKDSIGNAIYPYPFRPGE